MPVYRDNNGTWRFSFRKRIEGKTYSLCRRGFKSKIEAQKAEYDAILKINEENSKPNIEEPINGYTLNYVFSSFLEYRKKKIKITTLNGDQQKYNNHISPLGDVFINDLNPKLIQEWKDELIAKDMTEKYTNQVIYLFKQIVQFAINKNYLDDASLIQELDKVNLNKIPAERNIWTLEQLEQFLATFILEIESERDYYEYFYCLFNSGMRPNEFRCLQVKDIQGNYLSVTKNITSKITGKGDIIMPPKNKSSVRKVLMPDDAIAMLNKRVAGYKSNDYIFGKTAPFRETNLLRSLHKHAKAANLTSIVLYGFRHSHATHLIRSGVPVKIVSKRLGHRDVSTTMNVYWHLFNEDEEIALDALKKHKK